VKESQINGESLVASSLKLWG